MGELMMKNLFKQNDIRGKVSTDSNHINEVFAYKLGFAIGLKFNPKKVHIGFDMRPSSPALVLAVHRGLCAHNLTIEVKSLGNVPSPMLYHYSKDADVSIMVTASHNPYDENGFKICLRNGLPVGRDTGLLDLVHLMETIPYSNNIIHPPIDVTGDSSMYLNSYAKQYLSKIKLTRSKIRKHVFVVDCNNGVGVRYFSMLREAFPEHLWLAINADTALPPVHEGNPLVKECWADFLEERRHLPEWSTLKHDVVGFMFDGDADRLGVHAMNPIPFDAIGVLLVQSNNFKKVCYDLRCNFRIPRFLRDNNIESYETKVGHTYVKQTMRDHDMDFGWELSGHCYYREHLYTDTPLLAIRDLVLLLESQDSTLDVLVEPYWGMWASEEINFSMSTTLEMDMVCNNIKNLFDDIDSVNTLDGTKVLFKDGSWILARKSGTQNVVRIIVEGTTNQQRDTLLSKAQSFIEGCGGVIVDTLQPDGPVINLAFSNNNERVH